MREVDGSSPLVSTNIKKLVLNPDREQVRVSLRSLQTQEIAMAFGCCACSQISVVGKCFFYDYFFAQLRFIKCNSSRFAEN